MKTVLYHDFQESEATLVLAGPGGRHRLSYLKEALNSRNC